MTTEATYRAIAATCRASRIAGAASGLVTIECYDGEGNVAARCRKMGGVSSYWVAEDTTED